jgi:hypothetical protein
MELNLLARQHDAADEEEITLFVMKEKKLWHFTGVILSIIAAQTYVDSYDRYLVLEYFDSFFACLKYAPAIAQLVE